MTDDAPRYELKFTRDGPFDSPLIIEDTETGERIAEMDVKRGPAIEGPSPSITMVEGVCTKVFDGHHWRRPPMQLGHEAEVRKCALCGKEQRKVDRWEDVDD